MPYAQLLRHRWLIATLLFSLFANLILWLLAWLHFPDTTAAILHYSTTIGIDSYGDSKQIFILPKIGLVLLSLNASLGFLLRPIDLRAAWIAWGITPIVQLILVGAYFLIWQANQ